MEESLEPNTDVIKEISDKSNKPDSEEKKESITEKVTNSDENIPNSQNNSAPKVDLKKENETPAENNLKPQNDSAPKVNLKKENTIPVKNIPKPKKELPLEKKPFQEFINDHLIPSLIEEINLRGLEINQINLDNYYNPD